MNLNLTLSCGCNLSGTKYIILIGLGEGYSAHIREFGIAYCHCQIGSILLQVYLELKTSINEYWPPKEEEKEEKDEIKKVLMTTNKDINNTISKVELLFQEIGYDFEIREYTDKVTIN